MEDGVADLDTVQLSPINAVSVHSSALMIPWISIHGVYHLGFTTSLSVLGVSEELQ